MKKIFLLVALVLVCVAQAAFADGGIMVIRAFDGAVEAGEIFEVRLSVDVSQENKPSMYIITESVPEEFEIIDTDAKIKSNDSSMKWLAINGLFGEKVEDTAYVYSLRAPEATGKYLLDGSIMLDDKMLYRIDGMSEVNVVEKGSKVSYDAEKAYDMGVIPYAVVLLIVAFLVVFYPRTKKEVKGKKRGKK